MNNKMIIVEGNKYPSLNAALKKYGVKRATYYKRRERGKSPTEALTHTLYNSLIGRKVIVEGVEYPSIRASLRKYGRVLPTYYKRRQRGLSVEDAIISPLSPGNNKPLVLEGKRFGSRKEAAIYYGVSTQLLRRNIRSGAYPGTRRVPQSGKEVTINGISYSTLTKAFAAYGISRQLVHNRMRKGDTLEEAITRSKKLRLMEKE